MDHTDMNKPVTLQVVLSCLDFAHRMCSWFYIHMHLNVCVFAIMSLLHPPPLHAFWPFVNVPLWVRSYFQLLAVSECCDIWMIYLYHVSRLKCWVFSINSLDNSIFWKYKMLSSKYALYQVTHGLVPKLFAFFFFNSLMPSL